MQERSRHFTRKGAQKAAAKLNSRPTVGRSSGWKHLDYTVQETTGMRRYRVVGRST